MADHGRRRGGRGRQGRPHLARSFSAEPCRLLPGDVGHDGITELAEELVADGPIELVVNNVRVRNRQGVLDVGPASSTRCW